MTARPVSASGKPLLVSHDPSGCCWVESQFTPLSIAELIWSWLKSPGAARAAGAATQSPGAIASAVNAPRHPARAFLLMLNLLEVRRKDRRLAPWAILFYTALRSQGQDEKK